jgi:hypothetical protein
MLRPHMFGGECLKPTRLNLNPHPRKPEGAGTKCNFEGGFGACGMMVSLMEGGKRSGND